MTNCLHLAFVIREFVILLRWWRSAMIDPAMENGPIESVMAAAASGAEVYLSSREGTTVVIEHGPSLRVLANNKLDETIDASPAIVGREMIVRGENHLDCIAEP